MAVEEEGDYAGISIAIFTVIVSVPRGYSKDINHSDSLLSRPLASSITAPCIPLVLDEFHRSSQLYGAWMLSVYVLGYAFGPILCAPLSELYGRQVVYHSFNSLFLVFIIACAVAPSIESLIGFRFLAGVAGACAITLGSATIGDMIVPARRGIAIGLFAVGPLGELLVLFSLRLSTDYAS